MGNFNTPFNKQLNKTLLKILYHNSQFLLYITISVVRLAKSQIQYRLGRVFILYKF